MTFLFFCVLYGNIFSFALEFDTINAIVGTSQSLAQRYFAKCTILLHPYQNNVIDRDVFLITKRFASLQFSGGCVLTKNVGTVRTNLNDLGSTKCSRVLIVALGAEDLLRDPFVKLTHEINAMKGPLWFLFLNETTQIDNYLIRVNAPFDVDMVVGQYNSKSSLMELNEVYRVSLNHTVRVKFFGNWTFTDGLYAPNHVSLYYRRQDLEGIQFRVASTASKPYSTIFKTENGAYDISGYFATVWKHLEYSLNFTSLYFPAVDNYTGSKTKDGWSGITGMVKRQDVDFGVTFLIISPERSKDVDFLRPLVSTRNQMYFRKSGLQIRMDSLFRPFQRWIWMTMLLWIVIGSLIFSTTMKIAVFFKIENSMIGKDFSIVNSFFCIMRSFTQQGNPSVPQSCSGRIIFISAYLVGVVMIAAYAGALISFIAVQISKQPFKNLTDLLNDGTYRLNVLKNSATYMYFADSNHSTLKAVYNKLIDKTNLANTYNDGLQHVCNQKNVVFFGSQSLSDIAMEELNKNGCEIMSLQQPLNAVYASIMLYKINQYKDALNHHLDLMVYQGVLGRMRKAAIPIVNKLPQQFGIEMKVEQVVQIHMILLGGIVFACVLFLFEKLLDRFKSRKSKDLFDKHFNKV